jgi:hypothetical protein
MAFLVLSFLAAALSPWTFQHNTLYFFCGIVRARLQQLSFTCRAVFLRKQLHEQLHERGREPCFGSFTMCLTLWEWVFREDQRVGQRVGCLALEVVKLLVKLLMKLYQTGPKQASNSKLTHKLTETGLGAYVWNKTGPITDWRELPNPLGDRQTTKRWPISELRGCR